MAIEFVLKNFATPIAFYLTFHEAGPKPAIAVALATTVLQILAHWVWKLSFTPFFVVASAFTTGFGLIDLFIDHPRFFRLEPFAQNALIGLVFLFTLFLRTPIVTLFAAALPTKLRPDLGEETEGYLRALTWIWGAYFLAKAGFFLWLAFRVDLGRLIVLRTLIGGGSLLVMFAAEMIYRLGIRRGPR